MEDKQLIIPKNHIKLQYELRMFQYEVISSGKTKLFHLANGSDDIVDSLNYAVWATGEEYSPLFCSISLRAENQKQFLKSIGSESANLFQEANRARNEFVKIPMTWEDKLTYLRKVR